MVHCPARARSGRGLKVAMFFVRVSYCKVHDSCAEGIAITDSAASHELVDDMGYNV